MNKEKKSLRVYKYHLVESFQPILEIKIIARDDTSALMGAKEMSDTYLYSEIVPRGFVILEYNKERYNI